MTLTLQCFRAQTTTSRSLSSLPSCRSPPPCLALSEASSLAADAALTDTTPYGLTVLKGALAAAGSAQCGELRRSKERHPRQGCWGRIRCDGAGSRRSWAALRCAGAQGSPRSLRIWAYARYSEIVYTLTDTPDRERFIYDVYVSGACIGTDTTGVRACTDRPGARVILKVRGEPYSKG